MFKVKEGLKLFNNQTTVRYPTGNYGSFEIDGGAKGSWEGFSIGGRSVFMHDNGTATGIYNDVDNEWMFLGYRNAQVQLYYDGSNKFQTTSSGAQVNGLLDIRGNLEFDGTATTTNQSRGIVWTGFDKEGTTDFSDNAHIKHITNSGGLSGSVLEIKSMNDSNDGVNFNVNSNTGVRIKGNPIFHDAYHPNADKWTTARTITLGGDLTGSVSLDGSSNVTLSAQVVNDSHTHDGRYYTESESNGRFLGKTAKAADADKLDGLHSTSFNSVVARYINTSSASTRLKIRLPFTTKSAKMLKFTISLYAGYGMDTYEVSGYLYPGTNQWYSPKVIYSGTTSADIRMGRDTDGRAYVSIGGRSYAGCIVHSVTVGYSGSAADSVNTGWSITRDDACPDMASISVYKTWHSGNDGSGSGLDADLLDGLHASSFARTSGTYSGLRAQATTKADVGLGNVPNWSSGTFDGRYLGKTANAVSASKWTTARTLTLTGDVTGSVSMDGSGNVSMTTAVGNNSHTHNRLYKHFTIDYGWSGLSFSDHSGNGGAGGDGQPPANPINNWCYHLTMNHANSSGYYMDIVGALHSDQLWFKRVAGGTHGSFQQIFHDGYHPNADKWTTARTITLAGDCTGSVSIDGSANKTLTVAVADNSHGHTFSNVNFATTSNIAGNVADASLFPTGMSLSTVSGGNTTYPTGYGTLATFKADASRMFQLLTTSSAGTQNIWLRTLYNTDASSWYKLATENWVSSQARTYALKQTFAAGSGKGIAIGTAKISEVSSNNLVMQNLSSLRFGDDNAWSYNSWAGLMYDTSEKNIYLGGPNSNKWSHNYVQTNANVIFTGVDSIQLGQAATSNMHRNARGFIIEKVSATNGETATRMMFTEHNSSTTSQWNYGLSFQYDGIGSGTYPVSGAAAIGSNATWALRRHNNSLNGSNIMTGTRGSSNVTFHGTVTATDCIATSDRRVKTGLVRIDGALEKLDRITGYTFNRTDMEGRRHGGTIAQDWQTVMPEAVIPEKDEELGDKLTVSAQAQIGFLVECIKELKAELEELKNG